MQKLLKGKEYRENSPHTLGVSFVSNSHLLIATSYNEKEEGENLKSIIILIKVNIADI
jgi:hypothetical protein